jgi:hypothetical protein
VGIAQGLLYFSLFATLLAALLAVLGKQWLLHYSSVGERGTISERGLERQRKFDGLRRWRFDLVMQVFPLLLQFSLLLFATALSIYLWTIHHAIASIALTLTGLGCGLYAAMIMSAVVSPDSPFQTSLSFLLRTVLERFPAPPNSWHQRFRYPASYLARLTPAFTQARNVVSRCSTAFSGAFSRITPLLPLAHPSEVLEPVPIFPSPGPSSKEAAAVLWALETSTDPILVETAAELVPELQWPGNLSFRPALTRLDETFLSCIENKWNIRHGMSTLATTCMRAFWVLDLVTREDQRAPDLWTWRWTLGITGSADLTSIGFWTSRPFSAGYLDQPITPWTLPLIAGRHLPEKTLGTVLKNFNLIPTHSRVNDERIFADFLFCLSSFFSRTAAQDRSVLDKR